MDNTHKLVKGYYLELIFDVNYDYHVILKDRFGQTKFIINIGNQAKDPSSYDTKLFSEMAELVSYLKGNVGITMLVSELLDAIQAMSNHPTRRVLRLPNVV